MSNKPSTKKVTSSKAADGKPKRSCNAFCFFLRHKASVMKVKPENMKDLHEEWKQLDAKYKAPYERAAEADARRYRREKERWESSRVKRPCNGYIKFIQDFMAKNSSNYDNVCDTVSDGAAVWKRMSDAQKAPWKQLANVASKKYAAEKSTAAKLSPKPVKRSAVTAKLSAAKPKTKPKVNVKPKIGKPAAKMTKSKVAGTKKAPKTIKKIKNNKRK